MKEFSFRSDMGKVSGDEGGAKLGGAVPIPCPVPDALRNLPCNSSAISAPMLMLYAQLLLPLHYRYKLMAPPMPAELWLKLAFSSFTQNTDKINILLPPLLHVRTLFILRSNVANEW